MEIAATDHKVEGKKQINEAPATAAATSAESGNNNVTGNGTNDAAAELAAEQRTKDNMAAAATAATTTAAAAAKTTANTKAQVNAAAAQAHLKNDGIIDVDMLDDDEQPTPAVGAKQATMTSMPNAAKVDTAAAVAATAVPSEQNQIPTTVNAAAEIPIISLSDGEDAVTTTPTPLQKASRKRSSVGAAGAGAGAGAGGAIGSSDEEHFRLKRRKIKVAGAPKMPLTGYVRYMNDRRESLRKELPSKTAIEHTKIIGEEWQNLVEERKAPYMQAAEVDKQRYLAELHTFLKARPDVLACELAKNKARKSPGETSGGSGKSVLKEKSQSIGNIKAVKDLNSVKEKTRSHHADREVTPPPATQTTPHPTPQSAAVQPTTATSQSANATTTSTTDKNKRKSTPTPTPTPTNTNTQTTTTTTTTNNHNHKHQTNLITNATPAANAAAAIFNVPTPGEIPIFTNEFLEHNKVFDMELRTLRKSKTDLEQQNAVLEKHVENMKFGVEKMSNENDELAEKNRLLEIYLDKLKSKLAHALSGLAIPTEPNGATVHNIDKYMTDLYKMATTNTHGPASLNKAKDIIRKLDLQIHL